MRSFSVLMSMALVSAHDNDETSYLLQTRTQQRVAEVDDCFVTGGCVTTTTTPTTTTTTTPTTTTTTPTTTSTTTTTQTTTTPTVGEQREDPPDRETDGGDDDFDRWDYCKTRSKLDISNLKSNNLGGMGPNFNDEAEIRYGDVLSWKDGVDLVITSVPTMSQTEGGKVHKGKKGKKGKGKGKGKGNDDEEEDPYYENNIDFEAKGTTGKEFIAKYNGDEYRTDVMAIGSLATGNYTFRFCFEDADGSPVTVPFVPMTFFDLDGSTKVEPKSYEEVSTHDASAMESVKGSEVEHECTKQKDGTNFCKCSSAKQEIEIPSHFGSLSAHTRVAAITMFFKQKSCFDLTYTLNYPHRVFLFRGQCFKSA